MVLKLGFTLTRDRPSMYRELLANVLPQLDGFVTVTHGDYAKTYAQGDTIHYDQPVLNLFIQWNYGFDWAERTADGRPYVVACFNDDALVADDWVAQMIQAMDETGAAGASTPRKPGSHKIFGGAFLVRPGIRLSGLTRWYYTDDEIQHLCDEAGGFTIVDDVYAVNRLANQSTKALPELRQMSAEDREGYLRRYRR